MLWEVRRTGSGCIDGQLACVRDNTTKDAGGGPYHGFLLETRDPHYRRYLRLSRE